MARADIDQKKFTVATSKFGNVAVYLHPDFLPADFVTSTVKPIFQFQTFALFGLHLVLFFKVIDQRTAAALIVSRF
ncbi:hypothetical protein D3C73_1391680 [compost metagenome]